MQSARINTLSAALVCLAIGCFATVSHASEPQLPSAWTSAAWDKSVGRITGNESASTGPMSFSVKPGAGALLLDQVNDKVIKFDNRGTRTGSIKLDANAYFDDVQYVRNDAFVLLDRLKSKRLVAMSTDGKVIAEVPLLGSGIDRGGDVTALLAKSDGIWVEVDSRHSVKLLNHKLQPCQRQIVLGRPIANAKAVRAALDDQGGMVVSLSDRRSRTPYRAISVVGKFPINEIVDFDMDRQGRVHVVTHEALFATSEPFGVVKQQLTWLVYDENLNEISRKALPVFDSVYEQRVVVRITPQGQLWQMGFTRADVRIFNWGEVTR